MSTVQERQMRDSYTGQGMTQQGVTRTSQNGVTRTSYQTTTHQPVTTSYRTNTAYTPGISTTTNIVGGQTAGYRTSNVYTSQYQPAMGTSTFGGQNIRTGTPGRQVVQTTTQVTQPGTTTTVYNTGVQRQVGNSIVRSSQMG